MYQRHIMAISVDRLSRSCLDELSELSKSLKRLSKEVLNKQIIKKYCGLNVPEDDPLLQKLLAAYQVQFNAPWIEQIHVPLVDPKSLGIPNFDRPLKREDLNDDIIQKHIETAIEKGSIKFIKNSHTIRRIFLSSITKFTIKFVKNQVEKLIFDKFQMEIAFPVIIRIFRFAIPMNISTSEEAREVYMKLEEADPVMIPIRH